jgi:hypothetical protein
VPNTVEEAVKNFMAAVPLLFVSAETTTEIASVDAISEIESEKLNVKPAESKLITERKFFFLFLHLCGSTPVGSIALEIRAAQAEVAKIKASRVGARTKAERINELYSGISDIVSRGTNELNFRWANVAAAHHTLKTMMKR